MLARLIAYLSAVPGAVRGLVSAEEKVRAFVVALAAGNVAGTVAALCLVLGITDPNVPAAIVPLMSGLVGVVEYFRRKGHGARLTIERDDDGSHVASDARSVVYGHGATPEDAARDHARSLAEYREITGRP